MRLLVTTLCALLAASPFASAQSPGPTLTKAILVTGTSSGIGRKITERLAADGYFVYATARKDEDLKALGAIKNVQAVRLDVTKPAEIAAAVATVTQGGRGLYGLVNNAGVATFGTVADMTLEELDLTMKVNAYGPVMMAKAFEPLIIAQKGRIVNIGSVSGVIATRNLAAYQMSKHAVEALTESLALQLAPLGVQVSVIEPGAFRSNIDKNMVARMSDNEKAYLYKAEGAKMDPTQYPEADEVAVAVEQALFEPTAKHRYMVIPRNARDSINSGLAEEIMREQFVRLVELNEGQPYTFERADLIKMLDDALAKSRPRTQ